MPPDSIMTEDDERLQPPERPQEIQPQARDRGRSPAPEYVAIETDPDFQPLAQPPSGDADPNLNADDAAPAPMIEGERGREPRAARRERQKTARDRNQQEISFLRSRVAELEEAVHGIEPRLTNYDQQQAAQQLATIDRDIELQSRMAADARRRIAEAMTSSDSEMMAKALDDRDRAIMAGQQLTVHRNMARTGDPLGRGAQRPQQQAQPQRPQAARIPPAVQDRIGEFTSDHPWYNPNDPRSVDSQLVRTLDNAVAAEGYDPAGTEYWDRLEDRMREYMPHRFSEGTAAQATSPTGAPRRPAQQAQGGAPPPRPQQRGPQIGAPADRGPTGLSSNQVYISPERKQAMMLAGALGEDGRTVTNRDKYQGYLKQYAEYDRANSATRQ